MSQCNCCVMCRFERSSRIDRSCRLPFAIIISSSKQAVTCIKGLTKAQQETHTTHESRSLAGVHWSTRQTSCTDIACLLFSGPSAFFVFVARPTASVPAISMTLASTIIQELSLPRTTSLPSPLQPAPALFVTGRAFSLCQGVTRAAPATWAEEESLA